MSGLEVEYENWEVQVFLLLQSLRRKGLELECFLLSGQERHLSVFLSVRYERACLLESGESID